MPVMRWPEVLAGPLILSSPSCLAARSRLGYLPVRITPSPACRAPCTPSGAACQR